MWKDLSKNELQDLKDSLEQQHKDYTAKGLSLDMTRGKPSSEQLDICKGLLSLPGTENFKTDDGVDTRNYGGLDGFAAGKELFSKIMNVDTKDVLVGGNSSLTLMHDTVVQAMLYGVPDGDGAWFNQKPKFICPVPGYDRHFAICEHMNIEMITVDTDENGPDMDKVEELVSSDPTIKGMWCVPKYANPSGIVYSDEVVDRLAKMQTAAKDFRIWWDNAYAVHHLGGGVAPLKNILQACTDAGNANRVYMFASTSKISFAGSGVAALASSSDNLTAIKLHIGKQTIGPDKVNLLRHVQFFKNYDGILEIMNKHAAIIKPKFDAIQEIFTREFDGKGIAEWSKPEGGYFVNLDILDGCAAATVKLAADAGVKMTGAGATFPYKKDPRDRNIRVAPTLPPQEEIIEAMNIIAVCVQLACVNKLLAD